MVKGPNEGRGTRGQGIKGSRDRVRMVRVRLFVLRFSLFDLAFFSVLSVPPWFTPCFRLVALRSWLRAGVHPPRQVPSSCLGAYLVPSRLCALRASVVHAPLRVPGSAHRPATRPRTGRACQRTGPFAQCKPGVFMRNGRFFMRTIPFCARNAGFFMRNGTFFRRKVAACALWPKKSPRSTPASGLRSPSRARRDRERAANVPKPRPARSACRAAPRDDRAGPRSPRTARLSAQSRTAAACRRPSTARTTRTARNESASATRR